VYNFIIKEDENMAEKEIILTEQGKAELEQELDTLKNVTRKEVSEKIREARSFGDLSENAEYDAAKDEQAEVEARIQQIEYMLKYAKVVVDDGLDTVTVGKKVVVEFIDPPRGEVEYSIVGSTEADPYKKKLSFESPIGEAILNHTSGETVIAAAPAGDIKLKIVSVRR
jgi:transcription elongation factor GreA